MEKISYFKETDLKLRDWIMTPMAVFYIQRGKQIVCPNEIETHTLNGVSDDESVLQLNGIEDMRFKVDPYIYT